VTFPLVPPAVTTEAATGRTRTAATLNGSLTDMGTASSVDVSFEWGTTTSYSNETSVQTMTSTGSFSAALSGLTASTTYHFRAKAVGEGTSYDIDRTFTTRAAGGGGGGSGGHRDTTPPRISDISVANITDTSADISWKTHEKSDSQVEYWASPGLLSPLDETRVTSHLVHFTDLTPGTTYYFKVMSRDRADNLAVSDEHSFTTLAAVFTCSDLSISPGEVNIGETVTISLLVANTGDVSGSHAVTLKINGAKEAERSVSIAAGGSETVTFSVTKDDVGSYSVAVDGLSGSFTVVAPELPSPPAAVFSVTNLSVEPAEVQPKDTVTITVSVANTGGSEGSYTVVLKINEFKEAERSVTVAAGGSETVTFSVTRAEAGSYTVAVNGLIGAFTVVAPTNWPLIGGIIGGAVIVGLLIYFLVVRRRAT